jgi:hypothetical protein
VVIATPRAVTLPGTITILQFLQVHWTIGNNTTGFRIDPVPKSMLQNAMTMQMLNVIEVAVTMLADNAALP